jgi:hypothetical protein
VEGKKERKMTAKTAEDIIVQAIQGALVACAQEDEIECEWIAHEQCTHVAKTIVSELAARGFEIVRKEFDTSRG